MSSFIRRIQRNRLRAMEDYVRPSQQYVEHEDGSMSVLHPTKGWRRVSARRRAA